MLTKSEEVLPTLNHTEQFAYDNADQWLGCVECHESHHVSSFCQCGRCFYHQPYDNTDMGTFVHCECGVVSWWD
jgi:hypothetical protein